MDTKDFTTPQPNTLQRVPFSAKRIVTFTILKLLTTQQDLLGWCGWTGRKVTALCECEEEKLSELDFSELFVSGETLKKK
jgi:hypothetical protein